MHIYKMVFAEREDFKEDDLKFLEENKIIIDTDYGTTEIMADVVQENEENKEIMCALERGLGEYTVKLLLNNGLDMVLVVY